MKSVKKAKGPPRVKQPREQKDVWEWGWWFFGLVVVALVAGVSYVGWENSQHMTTPALSAQTTKTPPTPHSATPPVETPPTVTPPKVPALNAGFREHPVVIVVGVDDVKKVAETMRTANEENQKLVKEKAKLVTEKAKLSEELDCEKAKVAKLSQQLKTEVVVLKQAVEKMRTQPPAPLVVAVSAPPTPPAPPIAVRALPPKGLMPPFRLKFDTLPVREMDGIEHEEEVVVVVDREDRTVGGDRIPPVEVLPGRKCPALRQVTAYREGQWTLAWIASKTSLRPPQGELQ